MSGPLEEERRDEADDQHARGQIDRLAHRVGESAADHLGELPGRAAATKVGIQQNSDMRKISSWAAIAAVPTAVAGIYGMNFDFMPELHWEYSYPIVLLFIVTVCIFVWRLLRKSHWL